MAKLMVTDVSTTKEKLGSNNEFLSSYQDSLNEGSNSIKVNKNTVRRLPLYLSLVQSASANKKRRKSRMTWLSSERL